MNIEAYKKKAIDTVATPMLQYIEEFEAEESEPAEYTKKDVEKSTALICSYLDSLAAMNPVTDNAIMKQIKDLVLALNDLNESTDYVLIETDAREAICELIQTSAIDCGLQDIVDDVTEEWRDW